MSLAALPEGQLHLYLLDTLSWLRSRWPARRSFTYREVLGRLIVIALPELPPNEQGQVAVALEGMQGHYLENQATGHDEQPENVPLLTALWRLVSLGIVYPRLREIGDGVPASIERLVITKVGERVLKATDAHPLHPDCIPRLRARCSKISDEVVERLSDAIACLKQGLFRAAVVMIGLAAEETIAEAHDHQLTLGNIKKGAAQAKNRLSNLNTLVTGWQNKDEQHRLQVVISCLESVRTERNRASHPGEKFEDPIFVEELLQSALRHLPIAWDLLLP